jgi:Flp pilus assembly protein TadD
MAAHLLSLVTLALPLLVFPSEMEPRASLSSSPAPIAILAQGGAVQSTDAVQLVLQGNAAFTERRFADALDAFTKASKVLPLEANVHFMIGYSGYMLGQFSAARAPLERALSINPRLTTASAVLGLVLYRLGKVADAVKVLEAGQTYAPADKDIADLLANCIK